MEKGKGKQGSSANSGAAFASLTSNKKGYEMLTNEQRRQEIEAELLNRFAKTVPACRQTIFAADWHKMGYYAHKLIKENACCLIADFQHPEFRRDGENPELPTIKIIQLLRRPWPIETLRLFKDANGIYFFNLSTGFEPESENFTCRCQALEIWLSIAKNDRSEMPALDWKLGESTYQINMIQEFLCRTERGKTISKNSYYWKIRTPEGKEFGGRHASLAKAFFALTKDFTNPSTAAFLNQEA